MSKVTIDLNEFTHLTGESVYNHNYYKHKEHGYTILQKCDEDFDTVHFYLVNDVGNESVFLFSCNDHLNSVYEGDLGFFWS